MTLVNEMLYFKRYDFLLNLREGVIQANSKRLFFLPSGRIVLYKGFEK